jgi:hypothetical protein
LFLIWFTEMPNRPSIWASFNDYGSHSDYEFRAW